MKDLLEKLDARKKELASLSPMNTADAERLWKKFRLEWNYNSNHIEGNTLTYQETELVLIFDQAPGGHTVREIEEMKAHDVAVALVRAWADDHSRELSEADIRSLNETLLVRPFWKEAITPDGQSVRRLIKVGEYKEFPNSVRLQNGEMFNYAEPHEVEAKMGDLISWYRKDSKEVDPAIVAAKLHYDFVRIHPFDDGNGRVSRLLMNYHLLRHGFPPVIIKSEDKKGYLAALNRADVGDFEAFTQYIGEQLLWSLDLNIRAAKGESVEEQGDWQKELEILERSMSKEIPVEEISNDLIFKRIKDSFSPLIDVITEKTELFDKFFKQTRKTVSLRIADQFVENKLQEFMAVIAINNGHLDKIISIELGFHWEGYLENPIQQNRLWMGLKIEFTPYRYIIKFLPMSLDITSKNLTMALSEKDSGEVVETIGKHLLETMKAFEKQPGK